jgi:predicted ester cyclase
VHWNLAVIDELFSTTYIGHELPPGTPPGPEGVQQLYARLRTSFPQMVLSVDDMIGKGDKVVVRWTGKHVPATGIAIYRLSAGKIVERWIELTFHAQ